MIFNDKYNIVINNSKPNKKLFVEVNDFSKTLLFKGKVH